MYIYICILVHLPLHPAQCSCARALLRPRQSHKLAQRHSPAPALPAAAPPPAILASVFEIFKRVLVLVKQVNRVNRELPAALPPPAAPAMSEFVLLYGVKQVNRAPRAHRLSVLAPQFPPSSAAALCSPTISVSICTFVPVKQVRLYQ